MTTPTLSTILYIAASLDGYIAMPDGSVDWLSAIEQAGDDYGYAEFFDSIDGLVMGRNTYEQILGFGDWPYGEKPCWICSRRSLSLSHSTQHHWSRSLPDLLQHLQSQSIQRLWLVGGSQLIASFRTERLISEYIITWIPIMIGQGIPLFQPTSHSKPLQLISSQAFSSGALQATYQSKV